MKKAEAEILAPEKSKILIGYLSRILNEEKTLSGEVLIAFDKIDGKNRIIYDINAPGTDIKRRLIDTEITTDHIDVLTERILNDLLDTYLEDEVLGVSRYASIRFGMGMNFDGFHAQNNQTDTSISINFVCRGPKFHELIDQYNNRIDEYVKRQESQHL